MCKLRIMIPYKDFSLFILGEKGRDSEKINKQQILFAIYPTEILLFRILPLEQILRCFRKVNSFSSTHQWGFIICQGQIFTTICTTPLFLSAPAKACKEMLQLKNEKTKDITTGYRTGPQKHQNNQVSASQKQSNFYLLFTTAELPYRRY